MKYVEDCESGKRGSYGRAPCNKSECPTCGTFISTALPESGCTCASEVAGFMFTFTLDEKCPHHGKCACTEWVDDGARDYLRLRFSAKCPVKFHFERAGKLGG